MHLRSQYPRFKTDLPAGSPAQVNVNFDGNQLRFVFLLPSGADGAPGSDGPPGEVTNAAPAFAINGTSGNSNLVNTLDTPFANDPPKLTDLELLRAKVNELITALRR